MRVDEAWRGWHDSAARTALWLGCESALEAAARHLTAAGETIVDLNAELLALLDDPAPAQLAAALQTAFDAWLAECADESAPLVVRDFELLFAQRLALDPLAGLSRRVLLLAPGARRGARPRLFASPQRPGLPAPEWLDAWTEVEHDRA